jgi:hypothetical protein
MNMSYRYLQNKKLRINGHTSKTFRPCYISCPLVSKQVVNSGRNACVYFEKAIELFSASKSMSLALLCAFCERFLA